MTRVCVFSVSLCVLVLLAGAYPAHAQWVLDGIPVSITTDYQRYVEAVEDGEGGIIMVWGDGRGATFDIYAQRIDGYGYPVWDPDGVAICTAGGSQQYPVVCSDGEGGAIIAWEDYRMTNWDIYAQKIDAGGTVQWTTDGVAVVTLTSKQEDVSLAHDGVGGAILVWEDERSGNWNIYAQRIDPSGAPSWTNNGIGICTAAGHQIVPRIIEDGAGGTIIAWQDRRTGAEGIYAQRLEIDADVLWTGGGVQCCNQMFSLGIPRLVSDGYSGAIITWKDGRNGIGNDDIFAQRLDHEGNLLWGSGGTLVCSAAGNQIDAVIASDGAHGAIIAWQDNRVTDNDIYAQRMNPLGTRLWGISGIAVCTETGYQNQVQITTDLDGGAIVAWQDARNGNNDLFAQRLDGDGNPLWGGGTAVCTSGPEEQTYPRIVSDNSGGAIVAWDDYRNGSFYIVHAQRVERFGYWGYPAPAITGIQDKFGDEGGWVRISWNKSRLDLGILSPVEEYSIWRMLSAAQSAALLAQGVETAEIPKIDTESGGARYYFTETNGTTYGWEYLDMITAEGSASYLYDAPTLYDSSAATGGYHHFRVIAHTLIQAKFWESRPDSGYSVDNIAPSQPTGSQAEQSFNPAGLKLTWNSNPEIDLLHYKIYRGDPDVMTMNREIFLATTQDTTYFDDEWRWHFNYYYKIAAVDLNGNEGEADSIGRGDVTGDEAPETPLASYLDQNFPNPFNPTTNIYFGLNEPADVSLMIFDVTGRLIRTLIREKRAAGVYRETWDGTDNLGDCVASGMYFYKLQAGSFSETRKMVLTR